MIFVEKKENNGYITIRISKKLWNQVNEQAEIAGIDTGAFLQKLLNGENCDIL